MAPTLAFSRSSRFSLCRLAVTETTEGVGKAVKKVEGQIKSKAVESVLDAKAGNEKRRGVGDETGEGKSHGMKEEGERDKVTTREGEQGMVRRTKKAGRTATGRAEAE